MATTHSISYRRSGSQGILKLSGVVDIFEATSLHTAAKRALNDTKANTLCVELSLVERLDVAALQILCALGRDAQAAGRVFRTEGLSEELAGKIGRLGLTL